MKNNLEPETYYRKVLRKYYEEVFRTDYCPPFHKLKPEDKKAISGTISFTTYAARLELQKAYKGVDNAIFKIFSRN